MTRGDTMMNTSRPIILNYVGERVHFGRTEDIMLQFPQKLIINFGVDSFSAFPSLSKLKVLPLH